MKDMKQILQQRRELKKDSFQQLADLSGLSKSYIAKIFKDPETPVPFGNKKFRKVLDVYELPYHDIADDKTEKQFSGHALRQAKEQLITAVQNRVHGCDPLKAIPIITQALMSAQFDDERNEDDLPHLVLSSYFTNGDVSHGSMDLTDGPVDYYYWEYLSCFPFAVRDIAHLARLNLQSVVFSDSTFKVVYRDKVFEYNESEGQSTLNKIQELYLKNEKFKELVDAAVGLTENKVN